LHPNFRWDRDPSLSENPNFVGKGGAYSDKGKGKGKGKEKNRHVSTVVGEVEDILQRCSDQLSSILTASRDELVGAPVSPLSKRRAAGAMGSAPGSLPRLRARSDENGEFGKGVRVTPPFIPARENGGPAAQEEEDQQQQEQPQNEEDVVVEEGDWEEFEP